MGGGHSRTGRVAGKGGAEGIEVAEENRGDRWGIRMWKEIKELAEEVEAGGSVRLMCHCRQERHPDWRGGAKGERHRGDTPCHLEPMADTIESIAERIRKGRGYGKEGDDEGRVRGGNVEMEEAGEAKQPGDGEKKEGDEENARGGEEMESGEAMDTEETDRPNQGEGRKKKRKKRSSQRSRQRGQKRKHEAADETE